MKSPHNRCYPAPMLHLCIVLLGLAVLSWGAEYKYSLYFPPSQSQPQVPPAKLLSQKERPTQAKSAAVDATSSKPSIAGHRSDFNSAANGAAASFGLRKAGARDEGLLRGQLGGGISDDSDVYEKEYPIIEAAHSLAQ